MAQILVPTQSYEEWRRLLARPDRQWKSGFSAMTLARSWDEAHGFPPEVDAILRSSEFLWLVIDRTDGSVCLKHPGFDPDLRITADLSTFYNAWLGRITLVDARRRGAVRIEGDRALERNFPEMLRWSPMARAVRTAVLDGLPTAVGLGVERRH